MQTLISINTPSNQPEAFYIGELRAISAFSRLANHDEIEPAIKKLADLTGLNPDTVKTLYEMDNKYQFSALLSRVNRSLFDYVAEAYNG